MTDYVSLPVGTVDLTDRLCILCSCRSDECRNVFILLDENRGSECPRCGSRSFTRWGRFRVIFVPELEQTTLITKDMIAPADLMADEPASTQPELPAVRIIADEDHES